MKRPAFVVLAVTTAVVASVGVLVMAGPSTIPTTVEVAPERIKRAGNSAYGSSEWLQDQMDACDDRLSVCVWVLWSGTTWEERQRLIGSTWEERQAVRPVLTWEDWYMHGPLDKLRPREVLPDPTRDGFHADHYLHVVHNA